MRLHSRLFDVVLEEVAPSRRVLAPVVDNHAGGLDNLGGVALGVDLAETGPLSELHLVVHLHDGDTVLSAERLHELLVSGLGAVVREDAKLSPTLVEVLGAFTDTTHQTVVADGALHHILESGKLVPVLNWLLGHNLWLGNLFSFDVHFFTQVHT